jgi:hypothetical protein
VYVEVTGGHIGPVDPIGYFDRRHTSCAWQINIVCLLKSPLTVIELGSNLIIKLGFWSGFFGVGAAESYDRFWFWRSKVSWIRTVPKPQMLTSSVIL